MRRGGTWIQRWRVPLGFVCAALFILLARPSRTTLVAGAIISVAGLALRAWSAGHIRKNDALAISGPYAYTRNPLYLGSFLMGFGFTIASARWPLAVLFGGIFLGIYYPVMRVEASTLAELFKDGYPAYARTVPLFLPRLSPYQSGATANRFDRTLYLRYREYQAALGLLVLWGILVFKAYYLK